MGEGLALFGRSGCGGWLGLWGNGLGFRVGGAGAELGEAEVKDLAADGGDFVLLGGTWFGAGWGRRDAL
ncbi:MAG: hypothetical protein HYY30_10605 [Chloroflexi bacterium]|nr:hypothetical protein [Chloroflexota bacterium]